MTALPIPVHVLESLRIAHNKLVLLLYRTFALVTLYGVLLLVFGYAFYMGFYAMNSTWMAPVIISPTNDKILDLTSRIVTSEQTLASLNVDRVHQVNSLGEMQKMMTSLMALDSKFQNALQAQTRNNKTDGPELVQLDAQKLTDNQKTGTLIRQLDEVEAQIDRDLKAGLIAKTDAAMAKASVAQTRTSYTDSRAAEVLMRDNIRQKTSDHINTVDELSKEAELKSNIVQLEILIKSGEAQLRFDLQQIDQLKTAIATAQNSPYFLATKGEVQFAFVPYSNQAEAKPGAAVYGCYLNMAACRRVGTVKQVFKDEETINHPVFKTAIRGFMVQLSLTNTEAAKDSTLFLRHKPLLF